MVCSPLAVKLERRADDEETICLIFLMGAVSISRQENPRRLELLLNGVLPAGNAYAPSTDKQGEISSMRLLILGSLAGPLGGRQPHRHRPGRHRPARRRHRRGVVVAARRRGRRSGAGGRPPGCGRADRPAAAERIATPVVACGIGTDTHAAVAAIQAGRPEYLPLPPDPDLIAAVLEAVADDNHAFVHADPAHAPAAGAGRARGPSEASILVTGQSGTGKELLARFVHADRARRPARFVAVNCAAIPDTAGKRAVRP